MRQAVVGMPTWSVKGISVIFKVHSNSRFYRSMNTVFQEEQRKSVKGENKMMREVHHHKKVFLIVGYSQYLCQNKAFVPLQISRLLLRFTESISIEFLKKHFIFKLGNQDNLVALLYDLFHQSFPVLFSNQIQPLQGNQDAGPSHWPLHDIKEKTFLCSLSSLPVVA